MTKSINQTFDDDEFQKLADVKGWRTWKTAIKEEFGIVDSDDEEGDN